MTPIMTDKLLHRIPLTSITYATGTRSVQLVPECWSFSLHDDDMEKEKSLVFPIEKELTEDSREERKLFNIEAFSCGHVSEIAG